MRQAAAILCCFVLWACDSPEPTVAGRSTDHAPGMAVGTLPVGIAGNAKALRVDASGIGWASPHGSAKLAFGASRENVDQALAAAFAAEPETSANEECGAGPLEFSRYGDAFTAIFQNGRFAGWSLDNPSEIATAKGLSVGSARGTVAALRGYEPILQSSLGDEFMVDGVSGIYGEEGVSNLWAGANCIFR